MPAFGFSPAHRSFHRHLSLFRKNYLWMKKKKLSQALPRKLTTAEIIDFCAYIHGGTTAGLSIDQALSHSIFFLEHPLREGVEQFVANRRIGMNLVDALCAFGNSFTEEAIRRLVKMLIFASSTGTSATLLIENLIRGLERGHGLEQILNEELNPEEFKTHFPDIDQTPVLPASDNVTLQLSADFLEKQTFWKFLLDMIDADQSVLIAGFPSLERTQLIRRLQKRFTKTIEFNSTKPIEFLTSMAEQRSTLGVINGPNLRAALSQIDLYASDARIPPVVVRSSICQIFSFAVTIGHMGKHSFVQSISEISGMQGEAITIQEIFTARTTGFNKERKPIGYYYPTGIVPLVVSQLESEGLIGNLRTYFTK